MTFCWKNPKFTLPASNIALFITLSPLVLPTGASEILGGTQPPKRVSMTAAVSVAIALLLTLILHIIIFYSLSRSTRKASKGYLTIVYTARYLRLLLSWLLFLPAFHLLAFSCSSWSYLQPKSQTNFLESIGTPPPRLTRSAYSESLPSIFSNGLSWMDHISINFIFMGLVVHLLISLMLDQYSYTVGIRKNVTAPM